MTNLDSIFKSRDITLPTKVRLVKATVFPVVMYGCERFHLHLSLSCIGARNGNPLQCSCLENPRDGGASWAAVYGVAQSRTRLKQLSSSRVPFAHSRGKQPAKIQRVRIAGRTTGKLSSTEMGMHLDIPGASPSTAGEDSVVRGRRGPRCCIGIYNLGHYRNSRFPTEIYHITVLEA